MRGKLILIRLFVVFLVIYLFVGAVVTLRHALRSDPLAAGKAYVRALQDRDLPGIYLYSDLLGPRLAGMMAKSDVAENTRKQMWAKDFVRFKSEFQRGGHAMDSLRRERQLLHPEAMVSPVSAGDYAAEIRDIDGEENLARFGDLPGSIYQLYFRIGYKSPDQAPPVGVLSNISTGKARRIRAVVIRVEVTTRPDIPSWQTFFMGLDWLESIEVAFPFRAWFTIRSPSEVWMAKVIFDVDKKTVETF
ncbi:MAG: hypothetical protein JRF33_14030 [Deltaproteobacteria bacterium]|nr:hypothetical protein [Deltaproteobacteria bacterium]